MSDRTILLEEALESWEEARRGVIEEAENVPEEQYGFRPAEGVRDVAELLRHIMEVSMMMVAELTRKETDLTRAPFPELIAPHAQHLERAKSKEQLLKALEWTLEDGVKRFRERGEDHMLDPMTSFDGKQRTRLAWFHHGVSQEMYHRGQLATYQRLMALTPALTRRIQGG
jgi:uncharacterized damage-inducible protein DinB